MIMKDLSIYQGNNENKKTGAVVCTFTPELIAQAGVATGEKVLIGKLPDNAIIVNSYLVVEEDMTGYSANVEIGRHSVSFDMATKGVTHETCLIQPTTRDVTATITHSKGKKGKASIVFEYISLDYTDGTFAG